MKTLSEKTSKPVWKRKKYIVQTRHFRLSLGHTTQIMGILNITPDSFSGDGCLAKKNIDLGYITAIAQDMIRQGANIIDIGGESTRPGAKSVTAREECNRILRVIRKLSRKIRKPISVDTYKSVVAQHALDEGASIINNIMGTRPDKKLLQMVQSYNAAIVLMHIRGIPRSMQKNIHYTNLIGEIKEELRKSIEKCLEIGIKSDRIIIDPGIGFGKTTGQNLQILHHLPDLNGLNKPLLIGSSRKSFIGNILKKDVANRLMGTAATVTAAILNGAHIVRIHDIREIRGVVRMTDAILNYPRWQTT